VPSAIVALSLGILVDVAFGLESRGVRVVSDLAPIPGGLPPLTLPSIALTFDLLPVAAACTVLSLVESNAVARSIAARTGQRLDARREFLGQGLANTAAALTGGYPVSGSLARSALNAQAGARTRVAGVMAGALMIGALLVVGPVLDHTPLAILAGLLLVIAWDLVDVPKIRATLSASWPDALAFGFTLLGTWSLNLDQAIYLGVGISIVTFLRKARLLTVRELVINESGHLQEVALGARLETLRRCQVIRILHVEGPLFFGSAGELRRLIDDVLTDPAVEVIILRVKRASSLDMTAAEVLATTATMMRGQNRHLLLVGMRSDALPVLERSGAAEAIGEKNLFPARDRWFAALEAARERAIELTTSHDHDCALARARTFTLADRDAA
jgi:SulP family sulfate permease